jgi:adenylylsulfate kinase-like enzyme
MKNPYTLFFTGLSSVGKTTIANEIIRKYPHIILLDGYMMRQTLSSGIGFKPADIQVHLQYVRQVCQLLNIAGRSVIADFLCPIERERERAKEQITNCHVVWFDASEVVCRSRDASGTWGRAERGEIDDLAGYNFDFENVMCADLVINTDLLTVEQSVASLNDYLIKNGLEE